MSDCANKVSQSVSQGVEWKFSFEVKFYPVDPTLLHEELTRSLQSVNPFQYKLYDRISSVGLVE